jgi:LemA protein
MALIIVAVLVIVAVYVVTTYNQLQTLKTRIKAAIQEIGNQLKRQANLIPNLSESAKGYLEHEKGIFNELAEARKTVSQAVESGDTQKMLDAQDKIQGVLGSLKVVVESNPELKGADVVSKLMGELRDTSDKVMYSRRTLIDLVADYNRKLVTIPSNIVATAFGFKPEKGLEIAESGEHLEVSEEETKAPKVDL